LGKPPEKPRPIKPQADAETDLFAQELAKRLDSIIPQAQRGQVIAQVVSLMVSERFSGPIAHPKHLREYEEICPGSADRIIKMAEGQIEHGKAMQDKALSGDIEDMRDGRKYGFLALAGLIIGAVICAYLDKQILAGAFLGTGALGTVGAFIQGRSGKGD
jgi:uncharacterized membrane protein